MNPDEHYLQYQPLIAEAAWARANNGGGSFEDLMGWGNVAYCEALHTWEPDKGAFSTHLTYQLKHKLGLAARSHHKYGANTTAIEEGWDIPVSDCAIVSVAFKHAVESLGYEAKEVVGLIFNAPGELCNFTQRTSVQVTRQKVCQYLRNKGLPWLKVHAVVDEIKAMLRSL